MAVMISMVSTSTVALIPSGVPISAATPAVITSAATLRRQNGGTDVPTLTNICGYAVAENANLKSITPPTDMVCAMFPPNRLFGFCPKRSSLKDRQDIVDNCWWNAWCIDTYDCKYGCGIAEARTLFGTTTCYAASNAYCQLTRLTNTHTDEADPYWMVGCGGGHYTIHNYVLDQKAALGTSTTAATTTTTTTTTSSGKRNSVSTVAPLTTGDGNFTASHVQAPVPIVSTAKPVIPTSSSQPLEPPTLQQTPSTNTVLPSPSTSGAITLPPTLTSTSSTQTHPETQTSDFPTHISSANTPSEEDQNQKTHNPKSAILGSVIGALAVIYLILFTWWYRGPRRRKRAREAKEAAAAALKERGFWRSPGAPEEHGLYGANRPPPHGIQELQGGTHGPRGEIHELGFGTTMTGNPRTPTTRQGMPTNTPQTKTKYGIDGDAHHGNGNREVPGLSPLSPMVLLSTGTGWGGSQAATSASAASTTNMSSGVTGTSSTNSGSRCGSGCRACAESGIFGIEKPAKEAVTATIKEVAELDGRNVTFEVRDRVRREQLERIDLALEPVRWKGSGSGGGTGTGTTKGGAFGAGGGSNGAASTPMGAPVAWTRYLGPSS
ncbi:hypothetical protein QR685DRAFT_562719 [Neurospora intermedia]|uniref:Uncharacterized protein n=1 Tax=Neurospora intermedia TaxID=5142 RepID=A0ABR3DDD0_NEUIN